MRLPLIAYVGCSIGHVLCRLADCILQGQPFTMSVEEALTGWWPTLGHMASDLLAVLHL